VQFLVNGSVKPGAAATDGTISISASSDPAAALAAAAAT
jgi:hypothetical protein